MQDLRTKRKKKFTTKNNKNRLKFGRRQYNYAIIIRQDGMQLKKVIKNMLLNLDDMKHTALVLLGLPALSFPLKKIY